MFACGQGDEETRTENFTLNSLDERLELQYGWVYTFGNNAVYSARAYNDSNWNEVVFPIHGSIMDVDEYNYAWFRHHFTPLQSLSGEPLGLYLGMFPGAIRIYLNGTLIGEEGRMPPDDFYPTPNNIRSFMLSPDLLRYGQDNVIAIQYYSTKESDASHIPYISSYYRAHQDRLIYTWLSNYAAFFACLLSIVVGAYFIFMYLRDKTKKENLFIGIGSILISTFYTNIALDMLPFSYLWVLKFQISFLYPAIGYYIIYVQTFLSIHNSKLVGRIIRLSLWGLTIFCLLLTSVRAVDVVNNNLFIFLVAPMLLYLQGLTIAGIFRKVKYSGVLLFGVSCIILLTLFDIFSVSLNVQLGIWTSSYGMAAFVLSVFFTSANRFMDINQQVQQKNEEEQKSNIRLQELINKMRSSAEVITRSIQGISHSSQQVSTTSTQQAAAVSELVSTMEDSNKLTSDVATRINEVSKIAGQTRNNAEEGFAGIKDNLAKMDEIREQNEKTIQNIKSLGEKIGNVWEIVNIINNIADQTKIIAFNAELEASSAGKLGKNFEIVANEIRRLADNTVTSTNEIRAQINEIQHSSDTLILVSEEGTGMIREGWKQLQALNDIFRHILDSAEISATSAENIAKFSNQQASAFEQMLETLKQISNGVNNLVDSAMSTSKSMSELRNISTDFEELLKE
ncbi:MAG: methyl-accepting chemotaxis protein [Spirochaetia bacterium]